MGTLSAEFRTVSNDIISVVFFGENITNGKLTLASSPVILQMDGGGREYAPVKYTTASVSCVYDGTDIFSLATQDMMKVEVEIKNKDTGKMLFYGYVTPNSLNQPIDGYGDVVTIECVDWLGASKFVQYKNKGGGFSMSLLTFGEAVQHIYTLLHSEYVNNNVTQRILLSNHVYISDKDIDGSFVEKTHTTDYHKLTLSEGYFYKKPSEPSLIDGVITLENQALSCYDVLAMLAESVRATFIADGYDMMLDDIISRINGINEYFDLATGETVTMGAAQTIDDDSFCDVGNTITTLPRYELFSLTRQGGDTPIFCNILKSGYKKDGAPILDREVALDRGVKQTYVQYLTSDMLYSTTISSDAGSNRLPSIGLWACKSFEIYNKGYSASPCMDDTWTKYIRVCQGLPSGQYAGAFAIKTNYTIPVAGAKAYALVIKMSLGCSSEPDKLSFGDSPNVELDKTGMWLTIKCGGKYYNGEYNTWQSSSYDNSVYAMKSGEKGWHDVFFIAKNNPENYLADTTIDGKLTINFYFDVGYDVYYIKNLEVSLVKNWRDNVERPITTYRGNQLSTMAYDDVAPELTFGFPKSAKSYSGYIDGETYIYSLHNIPSSTSSSCGAMDFHYTADGELKIYSFLDRIEMMATHGDGKEYNLNVKDDKGVISPLDSFTSPLWKGSKICAGYTKDIEQEKINIILD